MTKDQYKYIKDHKNINNILALFYDVVKRCKNKKDYSLCINDEMQIFYLPFDCITMHDKIVFPLTNRSVNRISREDFINSAKDEIVRISKLRIINE